MLIDPENVMSALNKFRKRGKYCDIDIIVGKAVFHSHRSVLAATTNYFCVMFENDLQEKQAKVELKGIDEDGFELFMEYIYTGKITLNTDIVNQILSISLYFQTDCLLEKCTSYIKDNLNTDNFLEYLKFAEFVRCDLLRTCTMEFIQENFSVIANSDSILDIKFPFIKELLSSDYTVEKEEFIFGIITKWVNHDLENRSQHITDLMKCIRFKLIESEYIFNDILKHNLILDSVDVHINTILEHRSMNFNPRKYGKKCINIFGIKNCNSNSSIVSVLRLNSSKLKEVNSMDYKWGNINSFSTVVCNEKVYLYTLSSGINGIEGNICCFINNKWVLLNNTQDSSVLHIFSMVSLNTYNCIYANIDVKLTNNDIYCFPVELNQWTKVGASNYVNSAGNNIYNAALVTYKDVLFSCGGLDSKNRLSDVCLFDPRVGTWNKMCSMKMKSNSAAGAVIDNKMYITGGCNPTALKMVQMYDIRADKWELVNPLINARYRHSLLPFQNMLHAIGLYGSSGIEVYNPLMDSWTQGININDFVSGITEVNAIVF